MPASVILVSLMVALIGTHTSTAQPDREHIDINGLPTGDCVEAIYTAPQTESATLNLKAENGDTLLHVDYRVDWGPNKNTIVLNSNTGGTWGTEQLVKKITTVPGTDLKWVICAQENDYSIVFNGKEVATYEYRIDAPATRFDYTQYPNANSVLKKLSLAFAN